MSTPFDIARAAEKYGADFLEAYNEGLTCRQVGERFGYSKSWVARVLARQPGFVARPRNGTMDHRDRAKLDSLLALYNSGLTLRQIGNLRGRSFRSIYQDLKRHPKFEPRPPAKSFEKTNADFARRVLAVPVPKWVPNWCAQEYRDQGRLYGEEIAARHCRNLKREAALAVLESSGASA